ncbi:hypothetical protein DASB73_001580 [Starmerella bacillaris]|uniref:N-acetyltransferase domain-containing protein n=1 Tax=Starmerella bacillaris TaxID=1247836 RepID=A0AAV5RD07_STABA|nr:hypothetical protein DASB73_001580 [Starmerella bacillaris]
MQTFERIDWRNISWEIAEQASLIQNDGCRNDLIRLEYIKAKYRLTDMPQDISISQLTSKDHKKALKWIARSTYINVRQNPRRWLLMMKSGPEYVAFSGVTLPEYVDVPRPPVLFQLKTWILSKWYLVLRVLESGTFEDPMYNRTFSEVRKFGRVKCDAVRTPEKLAKLSQLSEMEIRKVNYAEEDVYHLDIFVLKLNQQGKGLGKVLMDNTIKEIKKDGLQDPNGVNVPFNGPSKLSFFASPMGTKFYLKHGFTLGNQYTQILDSGKELQHSYFFKNLD